MNVDTFEYVIEFQVDKLLDRYVDRFCLRKAVACLCSDTVGSIARFNAVKNTGNTEGRKNGKRQVCPVLLGNNTRKPQYRQTVRNRKKNIKPRIRKSNPFAIFFGRDERS